MSKGTVVIGGLRFDVEDVLLVSGRIVVCFVIRGPQEPFSGPITIFGSDGKGILQGKTYVLDKPVRPGDALIFHYRLSMDAMPDSEDTEVCPY